MRGMCDKKNEIEVRNSVLCLPSCEKWSNRKYADSLIESKRAALSRSSWYYVLGSPPFRGYRFEYPFFFLRPCITFRRICVRSRGCRIVALCSPLLRCMIPKYNQAAVLRRRSKRS
jgi:hypothetical protein